MIGKCALLRSTNTARKQSWKKWLVSGCPRKSESIMHNLSLEGWVWLTGKSWRKMTDQEI
jgi:hypothetical protein